MSGKGLARGFRCLDCTFKSLAPLQRRTFSTSPVRQKFGAVPAFTRTSNPELDALLTSMRNKIFLPAHLSRSQQDLIYLDKNQRELTVEPVYAYIKGERFRLQHIDPVKDVPAAQRSLLKAFELMKEPKDWNNLPSLLHGLANAKRKLHADNFQKITRKAGMAGRPDILLECARRVDDTRYKLANPELVAELMHQISAKAMNSEWKAKDTKQALAWAEMVSELLEDERHAGKRHVDGVDDVRVRPEVIGVLLQLSAVWATRYYDGEDRDGKVKLYAERLLGSPASWEPDPNRTDHHAANAYLAYMVPVLHGMKLAQPILGQKSKHLEDWIAELETTMNAQRERLLGARPQQSELGDRGLVVYHELLGPEAKKVVSTRRHKTQTETTE